ncbi:hypothetical protein [Vibrio porteresiae]|uniref:Uncharacterized protein n=1 Tax=Vibrio porteresiae DSM 19223 TaxID=1123496 RepID=A0ABZ0QIJ5_9VIBR|nr:hypothetical protein [Vibrio porteresiae]WPC76319.1 hypothetical protein R8Z52_17475 [Vibrio porteresiae DSM 19223]
MKRPYKKSTNRANKNNFEVRFSAMVGEYQQAKEVLDAMTTGTTEYAEQKKLCDKLFANAERYINRN